MALTRVPLTNITPEQIKEVLADYTISKDNVAANALFKSGNIKKEYIDPTWCAGDTEDDRFNELSTDDPISFYDYINYGGDIVDVPEIYFDEIKDRDGHEFIEVSEDGKALHITIGPDINIANSFNNDVARKSPNDRNNYSAPMYYRDSPDEFISKLLLNIRVKCDHGVTVLNNIQYKIKVTAVIGQDYIVKEEVEYFGHPENMTIPITAAVGGSGAITAATTGDELLTIIGGTNQPIHWDWISNAATKLGGSTIGTLTGMVGLAVGIAYAFDFVFDLTDTLDAPYEGWHSYFNQTGGVYNDFDIRESGLKYGIGYKNQRSIDEINDYRVKDGVLESPVYNFDLPIFETISGNLVDTTDIANSEGWVIIGSGFIFGSGIIQKTAGVAGSISKPHSVEIGQYYRIQYKVHNNNNLGEIGDSRIVTYANIDTISELVSNTSSGQIEFRGYRTSSPIHLVITFTDTFDGYIYDFTIAPLYNVSPGIHDAAGSKKGYHVLELEPRGRQYDEMTPPPPTTYIIELVPVSNCKLSDTKIGMFLATSFPDKDEPPVFDVIPSPTLNRGSLVKFENAKYADLIACKDLEKPSLLGRYHHFVINGLGGYATADRHYSFKGLDIIEYVENVWQSNTGRYEVIFAKEADTAYQQMMYNRSFVNRSNNNQFVNVTDYWNIPPNWSLRDGAITMISEGLPVTQSSDLLLATLNWDKLYLIELDIINLTVGYAYVDVTDMFADKLYSKYSVSNFGSVKGVEVTVLPSNVTIVGQQIRISANGHYELIVKSLKDNVDSTLKLNGGGLFDGSMSYCACRRLSHETALDRISPMINGVHQVNISGTVLPNTLELLYIPTTFSGILGDELIIQIGDFKYDTTVDIDWDNGITTNITVAAGTRSITGFTYDQSNANRVFNIVITIGGSAVISYLEIHNTNLKYIRDLGSVLFDTELLLSNCGLINYAINDRQFYHFKRLTTLDISNNPLQGDLADLGNVSNSINLSNTGCYGNLSQLNGTKDYINIEGTNIYSYSSIPDIFTKHLIWKNVTTVINILDIDTLIRDIYNSTINNGILDIAGDNPDITDEEILYYIFDLVHRRDWTILYNGYYITAENADTYLASGDDDYIYVK